MNILEVVEKSGSFINLNIQEYEHLQDLRKKFDVIVDCYDNENKTFKDLGRVCANQLHDLIENRIEIPLEEFEHLVLSETFFNQIKEFYMNEAVGLEKLGSEVNSILKLLGI